MVTDKTSGEVIGTSRYYEWNPEQRQVAIGYTFLARSHWGGTTNREMKQLMLSHAFRWAKVVWLSCGQKQLAFTKGDGEDWRNAIARGK